SSSIGENPSVGSSRASGRANSYEPACRRSSTMRCRMGVLRSGPRCQSQKVSSLVMPPGGEAPTRLLPTGRGGSGEGRGLPAAPGLAVRIEGREDETLRGGNDLLLEIGMPRGEASRLVLFPRSGAEIANHERKLDRIVRDRLVLAFVARVRLELAVLAAAITRHGVAVVALLVVTRQADAIAAGGDALALAAVGLELAEGRAAVAQIVVPVVARLEPFANAVAADGFLAVTRLAGARPARLELTERRAAVHVVHTAVVALLASGDDSVPANGPARRAGGTFPALLELTARGAAVAAPRRVVPVVAGLVALDAAIAAHHRGHARLPGLGAAIVRLDATLRAAAIAALVVAVVALLSQNERDLAVTTEVRQHARLAGGAARVARRDLALVRAAVVRVRVSVVAELAGVHH